MVDINVYRSLHKPLLINLVRKHGLEKAQHTISLYAATNGCKVLACYLFAAEELGYDFVLTDEGRTVLDGIMSIIRAYNYKDIVGVVDPENAPECLKSFIKKS